MQRTLGKDDESYQFLCKLSSDRQVSLWKFHIKFRADINKVNIACVIKCLWLPHGGDLFQTSPSVDQHLNALCCSCFAL